MNRLQKKTQVKRKHAQSARKIASRPAKEHKQRFEQLLDDAVFGVKKK